MDETDELIILLKQTVEELKKGIMQYSQGIENLHPEKQVQVQECIKEMHHIALRLNNGIEGLDHLKVLKKKLMG